MKKLLIILSAVLMLASCGGKTEENTENERIGDRGFNEQNFETGDRETAKPILPEEECDFGNFQWGMPLEDVVNVHGGGYSKVGDNTIRYERVRIEGFASDAEYEFTDSKLSQATYFIKPDEEYADKTQYLADYDALSAIYTKRFGEPVSDDVEFAAGKETDDKAEMAKLLGQGNVLFRRVWKTDTTEIRAVMARKDDICIGVKITPLNK